MESNPLLVQQVSYQLSKYKATLTSSDGIVDENSILSICCPYFHDIKKPVKQLFNSPILCEICLHEKQDQIDNLNAILQASENPLKVFNITLYYILALKCPFGHIMKRERDDIPDTCDLCEYNKDSQILQNMCVSESDSDIPNDDEAEEIISDFAKQSYSKSDPEDASNSDFEQVSPTHAFNKDGLDSSDADFDERNECVYVQTGHPKLRRSARIRDIERRQHEAYLANWMRKYQSSNQDSNSHVNLQVNSNIQNGMDYFARLNDIQTENLAWHNQQQFDDKKLIETMQKDRDVEHQKRIAFNRQLAKLTYQPMPARPKIVRNCNIPAICVENLDVSDL